MVKYRFFRNFSRAGRAVAVAASASRKAKRFGLYISIIHHRHVIGMSSVSLIINPILSTAHFFDLGGPVLTLLR